MILGSLVLQDYMARNCSVEGCNNKHDSKGFCKLHYLRWKRHGDPLKLSDPNETHKKLSNARKGRITTLETRKKMSESQRKRRPNPNSLEALRLANKNRIGTKRPEVARKVSSTLTKKWANPEFKKKMIVVRQKQFSNPELRSRMSEIKKKQFMEHPEYRKRLSESHKGIISGMLGKTHSLESKRKMSESLKGKESWWKGKKFSETRKKKMSEITKKRFIEHPELRTKLSLIAQKWLKEHPEFREQASERRAKQKFPYKDTKLELKIQEILNSLGIPFKKHYNIKLERSNHQADILVEPNLIIEGFGDYWHFNPRKYDGESLQKLRRKTIMPKDIWKYDKYIIEGMKKQGYNVLVVWEHDLKKNLVETRKKILEFIHNPHSAQTL